MLGTENGREVITKRRFEGSRLSETSRAARLLAKGSMRPFVVIIVAVVVVITAAAGFLLPPRLTTQLVLPLPLL